MSYIFTASEVFKASKREDILKELPSRLKKYKKENPDSKFGPFINHLNYRFDKKEKLSRIEFINAGKDNYQNQVIRETWEDMLVSEHSSEEEKKLANDLVLYGFYQSGVTFGPYSFNHIVPVRYWSDLREKDSSFNEFLEKLLNATKTGNYNSSPEFNAFTKQFVQNHGKSLTCGLGER